jgi:hypothetical protein
VTARGLTPNQLRDEIAEHGSREAVAKAHPEFADWLRASEKMGRRIEAFVQALDVVTAPLVLASTEEPRIVERMDPGGFERDVDVIVTALQRYGQPEPLRPGVKETPIPKGMKRKVAELRLRGESIAEIRRQTKLSKAIATRLVQEVDAVLSKLRSGRY